jgi:hypothetical protein
MVDYDQMSIVEQAAEREHWVAGFNRRLTGLDFRAEFDATGSPYSELDEQGSVVTRFPTTPETLSQ